MHTNEWEPNWSLLVTCLSSRAWKKIAQPNIYSIVLTGTGTIFIMHPISLQHGIYILVSMISMALHLIFQIQMYCNTMSQTKANFLWPNCWPAFFDMNLLTLWLMNIKYIHRSDLQLISEEDTSNLHSRLHLGAFTLQSRLWGEVLLTNAVTW